MSLENKTQIEIVDNVAEIGEKLTNLAESCSSNTENKELICLLNKYESQISNHNLKLAHNSKTNDYYIICDDIALATPLSRNMLDSQLQTITGLINKGTEGSLTNLWGLMNDGYELSGNQNHRTMIRNGLGGSAIREQITLNKNDYSDAEYIKVRENDEAEEMYVFIQKVLGIPQEEWQIDGVCPGVGVSEQCKSELGNQNNQNMVASIENKLQEPNGNEKIYASR